jgi:hypothetical protein
MREEPSLETLCFKKHRAMDIVQKTESRNTALSSKTFRDEPASWIQTVHWQG